MKHDWNIAGRCNTCGIGVANGYGCPGQPTPEPHLAAAYGDTDVWDRLRADLANLGVDAPAMTPQSTLTAVDELRAYSYVVTPEPVTSHENDSEDVEKQHDWRITPGGLLCFECMEFRPPGSGRVPDICPGRHSTRGASGTNATDFDALLLARRKRREAENGSSDPTCGHCRKSFRSDDEAIAHVEKCGREDNWHWLMGRRLAPAMSTPLTFEPRCGWKGKPIDE